MKTMFSAVLGTIKYWAMLESYFNLRVIEDFGQIHFTTRQRASRFPGGESTGYEKVMTAGSPWWSWSWIAVLHVAWFVGEVFWHLTVTAISSDMVSISTFKNWLASEDIKTSEYLVEKKIFKTINTLLISNLQWSSCSCRSFL